MDATCVIILQKEEGRSENIPEMGSTQRKCAELASLMVGGLGRGGWNLTATETILSSSRGQWQILTKDVASLPRNEVNLPILLTWWKYIREISAWRMRLTDGMKIGEKWRKKINPHFSVLVMTRWGKRTELTTWKPNYALLPTISDHELTPGRSAGLSLISCDSTSRCGITRQ